MEAHYSADKLGSIHLNPTFSLINIFDSNRGPYLDNDIDEIDYQMRITKREGSFVLYPLDSIDVIVDLYLTLEPPSDNYELINSVHIIEGIISVNSGILCISDDIPSRADFLLESGNYKFRVFFSEYDYESDLTIISLLFWPTKKEETNEIEILKQEDL